QRERSLRRKPHAKLPVLPFSNCPNAHRTLLRGMVKRPPNLHPWLGFHPLPPVLSSHLYADAQPKRTVRRGRIGVVRGRKEFGVGKHSENRRGAWRIATLLGTFAVFAWGMAAYIYVGAGGVSAESNPTFRDIETVLVVPQDGEWFTVKIAFFMFDDGTGTFDKATTIARE